MSRCALVAVRFCCAVRPGFLAIDLPFTLHAVAWDMTTYSIGLNDFSLLLAWNKFMQSGGRLGVAVALGVAGWWLGQRYIRHQP
jgi:hypothetical protein